MPGLWAKFNPVATPEQPFDGVFAIDHSDHDVVVLGVNRTIHHHFVAIHNPSALHGVALDGK